MTNESAETEQMAQQLGELTDLFRRRLLEDRNTRTLIEAQQSRIRELEADLAGERLRPLVSALALVIDRADSVAEVGGGDDFASSVSEELVEVLAGLGIREVADQGRVDLQRHELVRVEGGQEGDLTVDTVLRRGFESDRIVFRPAQVVASRRGSAPVEPS